MLIFQQPFNKKRLLLISPVKNELIWNVLILIAIASNRMKSVKK